MSRIRGTRRKREDTGGHEGRRNRVQEDIVGNGGTWEDTTYAEFGTVRPRVQIPGPRPKIVFKSRSSPAPSGARGSREVTDFLGSEWRQPRPSGFRTVN